MKFRENCKYDLMTVTSMGVRITPIDRQPVQISNTYKMFATSAESNVLNVSASLGLRTKVLTRFVADNPIAAFIKGELRRRGIEFEGKDIPTGNPWGYRHQFNIADSGYGVRAAVVTNDRAGEVGRTLNAADFDLDRIFGEEGCRILHLSGLVAALSEEATQCCLEVVRKAKACGTVISFDMNYRASFWEGREEELRKSFSEIASLADIMLGNEEDFQLALGIKGPEAGGKDIDSKIDGFKAMIMNVKAAYPNATVFATTLREAVSANRNLWGALMLVGDEWFYEPQREIDVLDRIGGGDGFAGGALYAMLSGMEPEKWVKFGWACGALVATMLEDYAYPVSEKQVWNVYAGNARVVR
jgi:2-dehydro-3-deoxygluconokinase